MSDAEKVLQDLYIICGGDPKVGNNPYMLFGYIRRTIEMLRNGEEA